MLALAVVILLLVVCVLAARWSSRRGPVVRCTCHLAPWPPEDLHDGGDRA